MKFTQKDNLTFLSINLLLVYSTVSALHMKPTYKDDGNYKNIAFSAIIGGSSHYTWVLAIGDELGRRGHNFTMLTTTEDLRFGKPFSNVKSVDIGPAPEFDKVDFLRSMRANNDLAKFMSTALFMMSRHYERDYFTLLDYFKTNKVDIALCDHYVDACMDAADALKIPYIVTMAMDLSSESAAPYVNNALGSMQDPITEFQSIAVRFKNKFIVPYTALYKFLPYIKHMDERKRVIGTIGIGAKLESPSHQTWKDSLKLINAVFGFTAPRPVGPMAEFVGPIIPKEYIPLTQDLEEYLNEHERVAYIAFGQSAVPTEEHVKFILTCVLESLEQGAIDSFLWATVHSAGSFPDKITTASDTVYQIQEMFDHTNPHARLIQWAPQTAVLLHPSTSVFLSHGGLGSCYESIYAATPMILFPFFGDQPGNALMLERGGLGGILKADATVDEAVALFKKINTDEGGEIKANVKRMQAMTQIHSDYGVLRGANIVEEVAYSHKDGKLPHRESADKRMTYIKSHNLDLYTILVLLITGIFSIITFAGFKAYSYLFGNGKSQHRKMKQL